MSKYPSIIEGQEVCSMSYFDGIIPKACAACFSWDGQKWVQADPGLCDACDYMLEMFPLLDGDQELQRKNGTF